jgi:hypothetical protein
MAVQGKAMGLTEAALVIGPAQARLFGFGK